MFMERFLACLAAAAVLSGCVDRPLVQPRLTGLNVQARFLQPQQRADSLRDWDLSARSVADDMARHFLLPNPYGPSPSTTYYIHSQAPGSAYLHEVAAALRIEIEVRGGTVALAPAGALVVNLDINLLQESAPKLFWPSRVVAEALWTASVVDRDRVLFMHREPLYIRPYDAGLYASDSTVAAIASPGAPAAAVRRLRFE